MRILLVGANPGLSLFAEGEQPVAFASVWRVDWSAYGRGHALLLWHAGQVRVLSAQPELARWLTQDFVRHFPEVNGLAWPEPVVEAAAVSWQLDLDTGLRASAGDIEVALTEPMDRRLVAIPDFQLGNHSCGLSNVYLPCRAGSITVAGTALPGTPRLDEQRSSSTAFLADAEVWTANPD